MNITDAEVREAERAWDDIERKRAERFQARVRRAKEADAAKERRARMFRWVFFCLALWAFIGVMACLLVGCNVTTAYYPNGKRAVTDISLLKNRAFAAGEVKRDGVRLTKARSDVSVEAVRELGKIAVSIP